MTPAELDPDKPGLCSDCGAPCRRPGGRCWACYSLSVQASIVARANESDHEFLIRLETHFWPKVDVRGPDECWPWLAQRNRDGYGQFSRPDGWVMRAHRQAYELLVGAIPVGLQIDHLCRNRGCVNPAHMEPVTNRTNVLRGNSPIAIARRTGFCKRGHPRTPENLYARPSTGATRCRICFNAWKRARRAA